MSPFNAAYYSTGGISDQGENSTNFHLNRLGLVQGLEHPAQRPRLKALNGQSTQVQAGLPSLDQRPQVGVGLRGGVGHAGRERHRTAHLATGLVSREMIALMKPTAYFVNTARAKVLDYDALYDALAEKKIAGAGLDVYPVEPIPAGNKFLGLRNVVLTPHLAGSARDIVGHQIDITLHDVKTLLDGGMPRFLCNPEVLKK